MLPLDDTYPESTLATFAVVIKLVPFIILKLAPNVIAYPPVAFSIIKKLTNCPATAFTGLAIVKLPVTVYSNVFDAEQSGVIVPIAAALTTGETVCDLENDCATSLLATCVDTPILGFCGFVLSTVV